MCTCPWPASHALSVIPMHGPNLCQRKTNLEKKKAHEGMTSDTTGSDGLDDIVYLFEPRPSIGLAGGRKLPGCFPERNVVRQIVKEERVNTIASH